MSRSGLSKMSKKDPSLPHPYTCSSCADRKLSVQVEHLMVQHLLANWPNWWLLDFEIVLVAGYWYRTVDRGGPLIWLPHTLSLFPISHEDTDCIPFLQVMLFQGTVWRILPKLRACPLSVDLPLYQQKHAISKWRVTATF